MFKIAPESNKYMASWITVATLKRFKYIVGLAKSSVLTGEMQLKVMDDYRASWNRQLKVMNRSSNY